MAVPSERLSALLSELGQADPIGRATAQYIHQSKVTLGLHSQPTGARWRLGRRIELNPRYLENEVDPLYPLSLIVHEVRHLQQGPLAALSVHGELEAWQLQFGYILRRVGRYHSVPEKERVIRALTALPLDWDRPSLSKARSLMRDYAGPNYRIDLLPLYPLHLEIVWLLARREPRPSPQH